jgi:hypothetical protein
MIRSGRGRDPHVSYVAPTDTGCLGGLAWREPLGPSARRAVHAADSAALRALSAADGIAALLLAPLQCVLWKMVGACRGHHSHQVPMSLLSKKTRMAFFFEKSAAGGEGGQKQRTTHEHFGLCRRAIKCSRELVGATMLPHSAASLTDHGKKVLEAQFVRPCLLALLTR